MRISSGADWRGAVTADRQGERETDLDLLLAGGRTSDSHALLSGVRFQNLLVEARSDYDLVVLHGPAATSADAVALVQRADAAVLVIDAQSDQTETQAAASRMSRVARTPLAAVLLIRA